MGGGQVLRELTPVSGEFAVPQFDLPLGWLAPGEYVAEFTASARIGSVKESVRFKLIG